MAKIKSKIQGIRLSGNENPKVHKEKYVEDELKFHTNGDDEISGSGQPLTANAASMMVRDYYKSIADEVKSNSNFNPPVSVIFGKETLMRLLSLTDCHGIRFYPCINDLGKESLVITPVDINGNDIAAKQYDKSFIYEIETDSKNFTGIEIESDEKGGTKSYTLDDYKSDSISKIEKKFFKNVSTNFFN